MKVMKKTLFLSSIFCIVMGMACYAAIPRPEHPRPQFERANWLNLNGEWNFAFDFGESGLERGWHYDPSEFDKTIMVPFCPESKLSGIEYKDFIPAVWYHRQVEIPVSWEGQRIILHFGAVDFDCRAWVNGELAGRHYGGNISFEFEITSFLKEGVNDIVVMAADDVRSRVQTDGKQSPTYFNQGCCKYSRTTGIWQTVWMEARPESYLKRVRIVPDLDNGKFILTPEIIAGKKGMTLTTNISSPEGKQLMSVVTNITDGVPFEVNLKKPRAWSPEDPYLYNLEFILNAGNSQDYVSSYAGLRKVHIEGNRYYINNKSTFLRFVLDQGYYPDGILTAPSDEALKRDIELSMSVGFNGARLHQKIFEERFHYWADKLGYLTWGETAEGWLTFDDPQSQVNLQNEWREEILRDMNHPSIVAWTPTNETAGRARANPEVHARWIADLYDQTRNLDPTRPVNDASGYTHIKTDIFTIHDYDQDAERYYERYSTLDPATPETAHIGSPGQAPELSVKYEGQPYMIDEYGGTFWLPEYANEPERGGGRQQWGYGKSHIQVEDLVENLTQVMLNNPHISGYTYTQLTDIDQEVNGVFTFDRKDKFDNARLKIIFGAPAVIED
jgi:beta-galactosidase/beta-glucuronidase